MDVVIAAERLPPDPASPAVARATVRRALLALGAPPAVIERAIVVTSELASNAVTHAGTPYQVVVRRPAPDRVRIEVHDGDPRLPVPACPGPVDVSGRGLLVVSALAAAWGAEREPDGKVTWSELPVADGEAR